MGSRYVLKLELIMLMDWICEVRKKKELNMTGGLLLFFFFSPSRYM